MEPCGCGSSSPARQWSRSAGSRSRSNAAGACSRSPRPAAGSAALLIAGWSLVAAGLVLSVNRPGNRTGALLFLTSVTWLLGESDNPSPDRRRHSRSVCCCLPRRAAPGWMGDPRLSHWSPVEHSDAHCSGRRISRCRRCPRPAADVVLRPDRVLLAVCRQPRLVPSRSGQVRRLHRDSVSEPRRWWRWPRSVSLPGTSVGRAAPSGVFGTGRHRRLRLPGGVRMDVDQEC